MHNTVGYAPRHRYNEGDITGCVRGSVPAPQRVVTRSLVAGVRLLAVRDIKFSRPVSPNIFTLKRFVLMGNMIFGQLVRATIHSIRHKILATNAHSERSRTELYSSSRERLDGAMVRL